MGETRGLSPRIEKSPSKVSENDPRIYCLEKLVMPCMGNLPKTILGTQSEICTGLEINIDLGERDEPNDKYQYLLISPLPQAFKSLKESR